VYPPHFTLLKVVPVHFLEKARQAFKVEDPPVMQRSHTEMQKYGTATSTDEFVSLHDALAVIQSLLDKASLVALR